LEIPVLRENSPIVAAKFNPIFEKSEDALKDEFDAIPDFRFSPEAPSDLPFRDADFCFERTMILSQAPQALETDLFLEMLYSHADVVFMLNQEQDWKRNHRQCYLPKDGRSLYFNGNSVTRTILKTSNSITESTLTLTKESNGAPRSIPHIHYDLWADCKAANPADVALLARMALDVKRPLIHCTRGIGRSGTLALVIASYRALRNGEDPLNVMPKALAQLRKERTGAVHLFELYHTAYQALQILLRGEK
jgi:protein tyrosine phosphatase